jgi:hippurate hydrolase
LKDLHAHPELSQHEHRTAERVAAELDRCGAAVQAGIGGTEATAATAWLGPR